MKNYFNADFHRVLTKKSRVCLVLLLAIAELLLMGKDFLSGKNDIELTNCVGSLNGLYLIGIMLANIWISFGDDIRAKSMQAALGNGVKRYQIVLTKWLTITVIAAIEITLLTVLQFLPLILTGRLASSFVIEQALFGQIGNIIQIAVEIPLTMIVFVQTQKAILGVLAYVYLTLGITTNFGLMAIGNHVVQKFQLWNLGVANQVEILLSKLLIGQFDIRNFLMVVFYFVIGLLGTMYLFQKKELDF